MHTEENFQRPMVPGAVILATHELPEQMNVLSQRYPSVLLPFLDKPFIQHIIESLVVGGIKHFDVLASHLPDRIVALLGDGRRWGVSIRHHLIKEPSLAYRSVKRIAEASDRSGFLLVQGENWPYLDFNEDKLEAVHQGTLLYYENPSSQDDATEDLNWSGWAWLSRKSLAGLPDDAGREDICRYLKQLPETKVVTAGSHPLFSVRTIDALFQSHYIALNKQRPDLKLTGNEAAEGIWLGRNVSLHPSARLVAPVFVGENCHIAKGVKLGPHSSVGADCMLSDHSVVEKSLIFPGSYVGESLELRQALVDRNCMVNRRLNSELIVTDNFILSSLTGSSLKKKPANMLSRAAAVMVLFCFSPWLLFLWLMSRLRRERYFWARYSFVSLPAEPDPLTWRTNTLFSFKKNNNGGIGEELLPMQSSGWCDLFFRVVPALINVVRGNLCLVGIAPRSEAQIKLLPSDWRSLYLKCKPGIITESQINFGPTPSSDQRYSADAFYSVSAGMAYDAKLLGRYVLQLLGLETAPNR